MADEGGEMDADMHRRPPRNVGEALFAVDAHGILTLWTHSAARLLGYRSESALGKRLSDLVIGPAPGFLRGAACMSTWTGELTLRLESGGTRELSARASKVDGGDTAYSWLIALSPYGATLPGDLTERDEMEQALLRWLFERAPFPLTVYDADLRCLRQNSAMQAIVGVPETERLGTRPSQMMSAPGGVEWEKRLWQALTDGSEVSGRHVHGRVPADSAQERDFAVSATALLGDSGRAVGMCATVDETTEEHRAQGRLDLMDRASTAIGTTLDIPTTARELSDVLCPHLCEWVNIDLLESMLHGEEPGPFSGDVALYRAANKSSRHGNPEAVTQVGEVALYPAHSPPVLCMAENRSIAMAVADRRMRDWLEEDTRRAEAFRRFGWNAIMTVPIAARGAIIGTAVLLRRKGGGRFTEEDRLLAQDIVSRAAVCIDNARRYSREHAAALTLQRSLLPQLPPRQIAVETASRYLPADVRSGIGGDWFDIVPLSGKRVAFVVGDVVGHGINAAATMGRLRTAVRTLADVDLPPDELLTHLDDVLTRLQDEDADRGRSGEIGATCIYGVYDSVSQTCSVASAGHPPPVMIRPGGTAEFVKVPIGPPLGVGGLPFESIELPLPENTLLAFYSDGLLNLRERDSDVALGLVRQALEAPAPSLQELCDSVLRSLMPAHPMDDTALLLARTVALTADQVAILDIPAEESFVSRAREWTSERLEEWGLAESGFVTELVVSELVTNAIRYGHAPIQLRLIHDDTIICEVTDGSSTTPYMRRALSSDEGGRGLLLVAQLTQRWGTRHSRHGKTIWCEQSITPDTPDAAQLLA